MTKAIKKTWKKMPELIDQEPSATRDAMVEFGIRKRIQPSSFYTSFYRLRDSTKKKEAKAASVMPVTEKPEELIEALENTKWAQEDDYEEDLEGVHSEGSEATPEPEGYAEVNEEQHEVVLVDDNGSKPQKTKKGKDPIGGVPRYVDNSTSAAMLKLVSQTMVIPNNPAIIYGYLYAQKHMGCDGDLGEFLAAVINDFYNFRELNFYDVVWGEMSPSLGEIDYGDDEEPEGESMESDYAEAEVGGFF